MEVHRRSFLLNISNPIFLLIFLYFTCSTIKLIIGSRISWISLRNYKYLIFKFKIIVCNTILRNSKKK